MTKTYPDQRYSNEHLVKKLEALNLKFKLRMDKAHSRDKWTIRREWIITQIIWLREGGVIRNDIMRDFGIL